MSMAPHLQLAAKPISSIRGSNADRVAIGHILVDNCSSAQAASAIINHALAGGAPAYVITPNAQHVVLLDKEQRLREIYRSADLVVADGISIVIAARVFGRPMVERVAGVDLFQRLCALAAEYDLRVFLFGGRPGSADLTAIELKQRHPKLDIHTYCPPMGFEQSDSETKRAAEVIKAARPDLLFVGLGAPKQECWISEHGLKLGVPVSIGVGGTFEMVAGVVQRAPVWLRNLGLEWLYRFCMEPRRMWRRYLIGNFQFCAIVLHQRLRRTFLSALLTLLRKQSFAAELYEPTLRRETHLLAAKLASLSSATHE